MNNIIIKGRISKEIELKSTSTGKNVVNFAVAVNRRFKKDETDFFECQAWGKTAEFINKHFVKGQEILLSGAMQCGKWQDKDGNNRYSWELIVEQTEFCGSKSTDNSSHENSSDFDGFISTNDDDLPF